MGIWAFGKKMVPFTNSAAVLACTAAAALGGRPPRPPPRAFRSFYSIVMVLNMGLLGFSNLAGLAF